MQDSSAALADSIESLWLPRHDMVQVAPCATCGETVIWGTTEFGKTIALSPVPSARWLLSQRMDDGLFAHNGSVVPGFAPHGCHPQTKGERREAKARRLASALYRSGIASSKVPGLCATEWMLAERIARVHNPERPSSPTTRALATGYLVAMESHRVEVA
jgi:hypothetical protein